jgi:hypothetical protein
MQNTQWASTKRKDKVTYDLNPSLVEWSKTRGVSHWGLSIYIKKYLKAKEGLWKLKYFIMQKYKLQKNPLKETKILQAM